MRCPPLTSNVHDQSTCGRRPHQVKSAIGLCLCAATSSVDIPDIIPQGFRQQALNDSSFCSTEPRSCPAPARKARSDPQVRSHTFLPTSTAGSGLRKDAISFSSSGSTCLELGHPRTRSSRSSSSETPRTSRTWTHPGRFSGSVPRTFLSSLRY